MKWLLAAGSGLVVLLATWPVLCMQGEYDEGSCKSAFLLPTVGTAETADQWGSALSLVATVTVFFGVLWLAGRRQ